MEKQAGTGEIVVSAAHRAALPPGAASAPRTGTARLLRAAPPIIRTVATTLPGTLDAGARRRARSRPSCARTSSPARSRPSTGS